jgi:hypothetical protein
MVKVVEARWKLNETPPLKKQVKIKYMKYTILTLLTGLVLATAATASPYVSCPLQDCFTEWNAPTSTKLHKGGSADGSDETIYNFRLDDGTETSIGVSCGKVVVGWIRYEQTPGEDAVSLLKLNCPAGAHWTSRSGSQPDSDRTWSLKSPTQSFQATYHASVKELIILDVTGVQ